MTIRSHKLSNGFTIATEYMPNFKTAALGIWIKVGGRHETKEQNGIAHFLEHMFFKGTKKRPGAKIAHDVETFGGELNAFTSFDYTCYYINCPNDKVHLSADILLDMVCNPLFSKHDIPIEREVVIEEFNRSIDSPSQFSFSELQKNFFFTSYISNSVNN